VEAAFTTAWSIWFTAISSDIKEEKKVLESDPTLWKAMAGTVFALAIFNSLYKAKAVEWLIISEKARTFLVKRCNKLLTAPAPVEWAAHLDKLVAAIVPLTA